MPYDPTQHALKAKALREELDAFIAIERLRQHEELSAKSGFPVPLWIVNAANDAGKNLGGNLATR